MKKKFKPRTAFLVGLLSLALMPSFNAAAQTFRTTETAEQVVRFFAHHSLGEIDGTLTPVSGALSFNPAAPTDGLSGRFTADMTSFDSGIGLRDKDMRKKYLHYDINPIQRFFLKVNDEIRVEVALTLVKEP